MKLKLTEWFPPYIKPVHVGVYEVCSLGVWRSHWDGSKWGPVYLEIGGGVRFHYHTIQNHTWRGLAQPPKNNAAKPGHLASGGQLELPKKTGATVRDPQIRNSNLKKLTPVTLNWKQK